MDGGQAIGEEERGEPTAERLSAVKEDANKLVWTWCRDDMTLREAEALSFRIWEMVVSAGVKP